jgi:hypothetical protein
MTDIFTRDNDRLNQGNARYFQKKADHYQKEAEARARALDAANKLIGESADEKKALQDALDVYRLVVHHAIRRDKDQPHALGAKLDQMEHEQPDLYEAALSDEDSQNGVAG